MDMAILLHDGLHGPPDGRSAMSALKILPDAGDCPEGVRTSQAVSHALSFFWLDGFAVPALVVEPVETQRRYPLSGTMAQTVRRVNSKSKGVKITA